MIPLRDLTPRTRTPFMTVLIILVNMAVFLYQWSLDPRAGEQLAFAYGMIPARVELAFAGHQVTLVQAFLPLLTSTFLHSGLLHILGNMWFLWIFGDNIEDYLGHFKYLLFYLLSGLGAAFAQLVLNRHSRVPTVGASGAIAGVLGAYFLLYPRAKVLIWFPIL